MVHITTVKVDLNWQRGGRLCAFRDDAESPVVEGQKVLVRDEDGTERHMTVDELSGEVMFLV